MARLKSEDKRNAILAAAAEVFAERGPTSAPTSEISRRAAIAEGTLFTYFKTKDDLVNAVYRQIKEELADAVMSGFPRKKKLRRRLRFVWESHVAWSMANPDRRKVLIQLDRMDAVTSDSRQGGRTYQSEIRAMMNEAVEQNLVRPGLREEMLVRTFDALAGAVTEFIGLHPEVSDETVAAGFKLFWSGMRRKKKRAVQK